MKKLDSYIAIRTLLTIAILFFVYTYLDVDIPNGVSMVDYVTSTVTKTDGTIIENSDNIFGKLQKGDQVDMTVKLPTEFRTEDAALCFFTCHDVVHAWYEDKLLYESGTELAGRGDIIGGVYPVIPVPGEALGHEIHVIMDIKENSPFYKISSLSLTDMRYAYAYVIKRNLFSFIVSIAGLTLGFLLLGIYFISGIKNKQNRKGVYIAAFSILMSLWIFSSNGFNTLISTSHMWIWIEYLSIFLVSTPLLLYFHEEPIKTVYKTMCLFKIIINIVFVAAVAVLNYINVTHFCNVLIYAHILLAMDALLFLVLVMKKNVYTEPRNDMLMKIGFWLLLLFGAFDIIRYNIAKYLNSSEMDAAFAYLPLGLTLFLICFFFAYLAETQDIEREEQEKIYFRTMAYIDPLTKINNRMKINEVFAGMRADMTDNFGIISFDLNRLKEVNDTLGHQAGDALICTFADLLNTYASKDMTIGRVGGDEFIVVAKGDQVNNLKAIAVAIREEADRRSEVLSFSYGIAYSNQEERHTVDEVYKLADERMYEMKNHMKYKIQK